MNHLPSAKRRELEFVVEVLREGFAEAIAHRTATRLKRGRILKIILFGSYARGDWVEDPVGRYYSDYDLLVVVDQEDLTDIAEFWGKTEDRLLVEELSAGKHLRTPISLIVHTLADVNDQLERGRYFFIDILREGIVLHEDPGHEFAEPKSLSPKTALVESRDYFAEWFAGGEEFLETAEFTRKRKFTKKTAFLFHQAVESFYHCVLLVRTLYTPKTHNLNKLRGLCEALEPRLMEVWPGETKFQRRCYELLREAYVKARYSRHYRITEAELDWLGERVERLRHLVKLVCEERLRELEAET